MKAEANSVRIKSSAVRRCLTGAILSAALVALGSLAANAQSAAPVPIHVSGSDAISDATPFFVALQQGMFKDAGLDVSYITMSGGDAAMAAAIKTGAVNISLGGASQYMGDIARGVLDGKIVGELTDNNYDILAQSGITDPSQLKGKSLGITGFNGSDQLYLEAVLQHYGIGPDDVNWVTLGIPVAKLTGFQAGKVDGIELVVTQLPDSAKGSVILDADASPVKFVSLAVYASTSLMTSNKLELEKFLAIIGKASVWARQHPDDAVTPCLASGATVPGCQLAIKVAASSKNPYTWSSTTRVNTDAITTMIPSVAHVVPRAKDMKVGDFVDTSFAASAP